MKINPIKNIVIGTLVILIAFSTSFSAYPKKAEAQWAVFDLPNLATNVLNGVSQFASAAFDYSSEYKEYILDPLVSGLAEMVLQEITRSIVNWINSGFEGSPSFVQNPGAFFLDIADQTTGQFISGDLAELCSPFSIDIRIALSFKYRPNLQKRYACTLSTIINNSRNAVENASINGFTAGDFKQGGWPAFVSLTTEPQNNVFGAYLQADSDLSFRVANKQGQQQSEISQGKGFLSWRDCKGISQTSDTPLDGGTYDPLTDKFVVSGSAIKDKSICPVSTPGSTIANSLEKQLNIPVEKLGLADEIGEIVNALFAQLATQVLQKGLAAVSKKDVSGSSYLDSVVSDLENQKKAGDIGSRISDDIESYLGLAKRFMDNRNSSFEVMASTKATFDSAEACYMNKIQANQPPLDTDEVALAQAEILKIQTATALGTGFYTVYTSVEAAAREAQIKYAEILDAKQKADNAKNLQEVNQAAETFRKLSDPNNSDRLDERNVQKALDDYNNLLTSTATIRTQATTFYQQCQAFPPPKRNSSTTR
ncbi:MAG: hypothetical protein QG640_56 [Patescibacteria group bacterium]|nr:hypothetical protein [Patescibacteria group bacterium]